MTGWRRVVAAATAGLAAAIALLLLGVQMEFACAWGAVAASVVAVVSHPMPDDPRDDAPMNEAEPRYRGSDVARLAWAVDLKAGTVGEVMTRRVRASLRRRLQHAGLDPDSPADAAAIDARLGSGLWERLSARRVTPADIEDALAAAERLEHDAPVPGQSHRSHIHHQPAAPRSIHAEESR
ncbi:hypothetical protein [Microbacterium sp.]|uniref:hypothetical protein n=1 Tax=Microbacterium sp. TaxID=51671 RepID=UPI0028111BCF|nr:hypothetical protein [Microbacterium sp.]